MYFVAELGLGEAKLVASGSAAESESKTQASLKINVFICKIEKIVFNTVLLGGRVRLLRCAEFLL